MNYAHILFLLKRGSIISNIFHLTSTSQEKNSKKPMNTNKTALIIMFFMIISCTFSLDISVTKTFRNLKELKIIL